MSELSLSATRRRDQVVILSGLMIEAKSTTFSLARAAQWTRRAAVALFSVKATAIALAACLAAMLWLAATAPSTAAAQEGIGTAGLAFTPWLAVWAARAFKAENKKGGAQ